MCKYGLIGAGMMGQEHIRNIALLDGAEVAAIFEPDPQMRAMSAALAPMAAQVDSVEALLARPEIDCLLVASPNHLHAMQLRQIARTRPLPLLMEKPLYTDPADAALIAEMRKTYPAPIWVAMEYRYMPPIARLLSEVDQATGGVKMLSIREHRFPFLPKVGDWNRFNRNTGGTLVEKCCHFFDLMRLVMQAEPVRVMASASQMVNHLDETYDGARPDIWDAGYVIVDFEGGSRAMLELCMFAEGARYQEEVSAVGPTGKIEAFVPGPGRFWNSDQPAPVPQIVFSPRAPKGPHVLELPVDAGLLAVGDHNGATFYQHQRFCEVVRGNGAPEVTLHDGAQAVAMGLAAQESATIGQAVTL